MRSLRVKLIITFLFISAIGTLLTTLIVRSSNTQAFNALLQSQAQDEFVADVMDYYEQNGSWQGVAEAMRQPRPTNVTGQETQAPPPFALADENGRILIANRRFPLGSLVTPDNLTQGVPVTVASVPVGTALADDEPPPRNPAEEAFVAQTNRALLLGALGATAVAILLGVILARTFTRPMQELATATRQMAQGKLLQEVPVRTQDELGELAAAFNQMSADLARANQARRQMTADIAHDLRTPLTVLSGYLEAMEDGTLAATSARFQMMQQEVDALNRLVVDLRTLSLADSGELKLQKEPVAIDDLLAQVQAAFAHRAAQQDVTIELATAVSYPPIPLDPTRIRQALGNLVSNALRHTPVGGTITLATTLLVDGRLAISVTDTGAGIPPADLPHIFDRFYRGDKSRHEGEGESGLGLAIVKSLVTAHDGQITVASTLGVGTTFTMTLPIN